MDGLIEGKDFFYDRVKAENILCSELCDLPTQYPHRCSTKCYDYSPKDRITSTPKTSVYQVTIEQVIGIVVAIVFAVMIISVLLFLFRKKVFRAVQGIRERLCEKVATPVPETNQNTNRSPTVNNRSPTVNNRSPISEQGEQLLSTV